MVIKIFASIGVIATFILGISLLVFIEKFIENVEDLIESAVNNRKYKKQLKSRFEGGPTAKCFCKDCKYYYEKIKEYFDFDLNYFKNTLVKEYQQLMPYLMSLIN